MTGRDQYPMQQAYLLLKAEVDVPLVVEGLVWGVQSVLVGEVAGHEG